MSWWMAGLICGMSWGSCSVLSRAPATPTPQLSRQCPTLTPCPGRAGSALPKAPQGGFPFTASTGAAGPTSPTVPGAERGREAPSSSGWVTPSSPLYPVPAAVLSSLRQLSISTSILSDPARVPEQAARAVAALGRPGASSS